MPSAPLRGPVTTPRRMAYGPRRTAYGPLPLLWEDGAMASLADATPPIALGALDGRYRGAVATLVDHLSEAALNWQRVHVEVEWLIHQTSNGVVPGVRKLSDEEVAALRRVVYDFGTDEVA